MTNPWRVAAGCVAIAAGGLVATARAGAQPVPVPQPGARVRVINTVEKKPEVVGSLVRWAGDTVVVGTGKATDQVIVLKRWHRVDASIGRPRHIVRNGLIGAAAGALLGAGIGAAVVDPDPSRSDTCLPVGAGGSCFGVTVGGTPREAGAAMGGGFGAVIGGLIGMATGIARSDQWRPVKQAMALSLGPVAGGVGVRGRVLFGR